MHQQGIPSAPLDDDEIDRAILALLIGESAAGPWAVEELVREIGDPIVVDDALARLHGAGLIHRIEGFAFATRAAVRATKLAG
jgi:hypothetical protein